MGGPVQRAPPLPPLLPLLLLPLLLPSLLMVSPVHAGLVTKGSNLLSNAGFESGSFQLNTNAGRIVGTTAERWYDNTDWAGDKVQLSFAFDSGSPRSGSRAQCVTVTKGFAQVAQWLELPTGRRYSLSLWVRVSPGSTAATVPVELALRKMQTNYDTYATTQAVPLSSSAGWVQLRLDGVLLPASASPGSATLQIGFMFWVRGAATACFDDASLFEVVDSTEGDAVALANPGFEGGSYPFDTAPADIRGTMANGWYDNTEWSAGASLRYTVVSDQAQAGSSSIAIQSLSGFAQFTQWKKLPAAAAYKLTIWARAVPVARAAAADGTSPAVTDDGAAAAADAAVPDFPTASAGRYARSAAAAAVSAASAAEVPSAALHAAQAEVTSAAAAAQTGMSVTLSLRLMGPPYTTFGSVSAAVGPGWTQLTVPAAVIPWNAPGAGSAVDVGFLVNIGGKGTVWLDSASLEVVRDLPPISVSVPNTRIARSFFGMNTVQIFNWGGGYTWPVVDFGWHRTWDSGIVWALIQKDGPGSFDWTNTDKAMAQAKSRGQQVMFTLGQTPTWASSAPDVSNVYGAGFGSVPRDVNDWKRFLRELLQRHGAVIGAVEVWNEPNLQGADGFFNGTPEQLAALALATQQVLTELNSKALLLNPPMAGMAAGAVSFLSAYLAESRRLGVVHQGVSLHSYNIPAELDLVSMQTLRQVMAEQGLPSSLPCFNTEAGILPWDFQANNNSHIFGAGFLVRTFLIDWAAGVRTTFWYAYDHDTMEGLTLTTPQQQQPDKLNDAGRAYVNVKAWLTGARMTACGRDSAGTWTASLLKGSSRSWFVWNGDPRAASKQVLLPQPARAMIDIITGARTSLRNTQQILLTDVPVLLVA